MDIKRWNEFLNEMEPPKSLSELQKSVWYLAKGEWQNAHRTVQVILSREAAWVHAYLHKVEGDLGNARYWYHQAKLNYPNATLEEELSEIIKKLILKES